MINAAVTDIETKGIVRAQDNPGDGRCHTPQIGLSAHCQKHGPVNGGKSNFDCLIIVQKTETSVQQVDRL